jgi:phosphate transport system substrate-binding protein
MINRASFSRAAQFCGALCTMSPALAVPPPKHLEGSAPTIVSRLARQWVTDFSSVDPGVIVDVPPPYEPPQGALSARLSAFLAGDIDFAFLSRKLSDADLAAFRRAHGYGPLVIPVAGGSWNSFGFVDPVVVIVNARNPLRRISFATLDAIFSKSRRRGHASVRNWGQVGVNSLRNQPIHLAGGASWSVEDSARGSVFRERVMLNGIWRDDSEAAASGTEREAAGRVASDPLAIGFTGLGHVVPGTRALSVATGGVYVAPTYENVASGRYPLARTIDLLVARKPGTCLSPALRHFIWYLISPRAQAFVTKDGHFLQLTSAQSRRSRLSASSCR